MRVVFIDVVIGIEVYRATALLELRRAVWAAMVAYRTLDPRLIAVAHRRLAAAMRRWLVVERLLGSPKDNSHE